MAGTARWGSAWRSLRLAKYKPEHPPEIEARLIEIRFLELDDPPTFARLEADLCDDNEAIRAELIARFEDVGGDRVLPLLGDRLASDPSVTVRLRAIEARAGRAGG